MIRYVVLILLLFGLTSCAQVVTNNEDMESNKKIAEEKAKCVSGLFTGITDVRDKALMVAMLGLGGNPCEMSNSYDYAKVHAQEQSKQIASGTSLVKSVATGAFIYMGFNSLMDMAKTGMVSAGDRYEAGGDITGGDHIDNDYDYDISDVFNGE